MADARMIARLADLPEFRELQKHIDECEEEDILRLGRKTYRLPEAHERLEWEKLKARYAGMRELLELPAYARDHHTTTKEQQ